MKFNYKNEAAFSKAVVSHLRRQGYFVQRVESGETGKGIPDIYCITPDGHAIWLELKREHCCVGMSPLPLYIHWRPGQQAWLHGVVKLHQRAYTLACFDDVILQIPHVCVYKENKVYPSQCVHIKSLKDL